MSKLRVEVRAKGSSEAAFELAGPNPTVPRVGEYVELTDHVSRVTAVTWKPLSAGQADVLVVVECALVPQRKPRL